MHTKNAYPHLFLENPITSFSILDRFTHYTHLGTLMHTNFSVAFKHQVTE